MICAIKVNSFKAKRKLIEKYYTAKHLIDLCPWFLGNLLILGITK
jgi:hypothetical protein